MSSTSTSPALAVPSSRPSPTAFTLTDQEVHDIRRVVRGLTATYSSVESEAFLEDADTAAHDLPYRLRRALREFRLREPSSAMCLIKGWPVDQSRIGPTPVHWREKTAPNSTLDEEILLILLGSLLGDLIAWSTQQDGRIMHDVLPIKGHEHEQLGSGSEELLWWHVEDAFHPYRGDYLGLMCLRNPDGVATTFSAVPRGQVSPEDLRLLSESHFTIRPDESHLPKNRGNGLVDPLVERAYTRIERMKSHPETIPVLFGDMNAPYMRLDPYFMDPVTERPEAQRALDAFVNSIQSSLQDTVLEAGDICFIDNYQGVHGRKPFKARFDGADRWLKRINLARDLRKSRDARRSPSSRVLY
jgi:Fe(II)/alpha-ketoglutarate-dependent arginine beta-hydroxylase